VISQSLQCRLLFLLGMLIVCVHCYCVIRITNSSFTTVVATDLILSYGDHYLFSRRTISHLIVSLKMLKRKVYPKALINGRMCFLKVLQMYHLILSKLIVFYYKMKIYVLEALS
jgi:hypothetical protein